MSDATLRSPFLVSGANEERKSYSLCIKAQRLNNPKCDVLNHYATVVVAAIEADDCGHD